jgi:hypothetical protein
MDNDEMRGYKRREHQAASEPNPNEKEGERSKNVDRVL